MDVSTSRTTSRPTNPPLTPFLQVFTPYAAATSGYLTLQALPLAFTPSLIVSLLSRDPRRPTDLEIYLCRTLGLSLLAFAASILPLTNIISTSTTSSITAEDRKTNPYAYPTLITTVIYHALTAFYLYGQTTYGWSFGFGAGLVLSAGLFCFGLWLIMFGSERGHVSKTTGADKRTSNFPFTNAESAKERKKEAKAAAASSSSSSSSSRRSMPRTRSKD